MFQPVRVANSVLVTSFSLPCIPQALLVYSVLLILNTTSIILGAGLGKLSVSISVRTSVGPSELKLTVVRTTNRTLYLHYSGG